MTRVTLLGPQRLRPTLRPTLDSLGIEGTVGTITAGWQEREGDDQELDAHLDGRTINLSLYRRLEEVFAEDLEFAEAHRERLERLRQFEDLYLVRLDFAMQSAFTLLKRQARPEIIAAELDDAVDQVRELDERHLARVRDVYSEFYEQWPPHERESVMRHRAELQSLIQSCDAIAIAGGHVAVLLNCMHLFNLPPQIRSLPVVAWSAGSMVVSEKIVLFHDRAPQGAGHPEVLDLGVALCSGVIPLPHARRRLVLDDPERVSLFARRFRPAACVPMDEGARLDFDGERWNASEGTRQLTGEGAVAEMEAA